MLYFIENELKKWYNNKNGFLNQNEEEIEWLLFCNVCGYKCFCVCVCVRVCMGINKTNDPSRNEKKNELSNDNKWMTMNQMDEEINRKIAWYRDQLMLTYKWLGFMAWLKIEFEIANPWIQRKSEPIVTKYWNLFAW